MNETIPHMAALTAEVAMLREHAARGAAAREARRARPAHASRAGAHTQWHDAGYAAAMREVGELATHVFTETESPGDALRAVAELALGVIELRDTDTVPADWSGQ